MSFRPVASSEFSFWQELKIRLISRFAWVLVWIINSTVRLQVKDMENLEKAASEGGVVFCFFHNQIFSWSHAGRFRDIVVITSRHFDGEYIARMIHLFGFGTARGSTSRGSVSALLKLKGFLEKGTDVAFTIDGPRGPRYKVKAGPLWLSMKTGYPILPIHIQPRHYWQLRSWDRFRIPRPFTQVVALFGEPMVVPFDAKPQAWLPSLQAAMDSLRADADQFDWSEFQGNWTNSKNHSYSYRANDPANT